VDACSTLSVGPILLGVFPVLREVHIREGPRVRDETHDWAPGLNVTLRNSVFEASSFKLHFSGRVRLQVVN